LNDLQLIKEEIYNCGLVKPLLESMGCDFIKAKDNRIEAMRPDGSNKRSVQVYLNESLPCKIRTKSHLPKLDIYGLVSYLKHNKESPDSIRKDISQAKKYIVETLSLSQFISNYNGNIQDDPNAWLKRIKKRKKKKINLDEIEPNPVIPESVLDGFIMLPHMNFLIEGIPWGTQKEYEIGYDLQTERITIPVRNSDGLLVGVKGRATKKEDESKYKYLPIYAYKKSKIWFNLHRSYQYILDSNTVICLESEKSCLIAHSLGILNTVSQQGSDISKVQAEILKRLSPDLNIVLAYDKDIGSKEVKQISRVFGTHNNLFGIIDVKGLLEEKQSPFDAGLTTWKKLYNRHCYKIN